MANIIRHLAPSLSWVHFPLYTAVLREGVIEQEDHRKTCMSYRIFACTLKACNSLKWDVVRVRLYHQGALVIGCAD